MTLALSMLQQFFVLLQSILELLDVLGSSLAKGGLGLSVALLALLDRGVNLDMLA